MHINIWLLCLLQPTQLTLNICAKSYIYAYICVCSPCNQCHSYIIIYIYATSIYEHIWAYIIHISAYTGIYEHISWTIDQIWKNLSELSRSLDIIQYIWLCRQHLYPHGDISSSTQTTVNHSYTNICMHYLAFPNSMLVNSRFSSQLFKPLRIHQARVIHTISTNTYIISWV